MRQKGFATIFGLCFVLVVAFVVKGIHEAEANHAREVSNFETEQVLQCAAESAIVEAAEFVRQNPDYLPYSDASNKTKKTIPISDKTFKRGEQTINITVEVRGERGKIYLCPASRNKVYDNNTRKDWHHGVYFMSRATIDGSIWGEKIYRRAYAHVFSTQQDDGTFKDDTTINFMELPTRDGTYVTK